MKNKLFLLCFFAFTIVFIIGICNPGLSQKRHVDSSKQFTNLLVGEWRGYHLDRARHDSVLFSLVFFRNKDGNIEAYSQTKFSSCTVKSQIEFEFIADDTLWIKEIKILKYPCPP